MSSNSKLKDVLKELLELKSDNTLLLDKKVLEKFFVESKRDLLLGESYLKRNKAMRELSNGNMGDYTFLDVNIASGISLVTYTTDNKEDNQEFVKPRIASETLRYEFNVDNESSIPYKTFIFS